MNATLTMDENEMQQMAAGQKSHGTVAFSDDVLVRIAEIAAGQVEGVMALKITDIEKEGTTISVSASTTLEYGLSVVETAKKVQDAVKNAVQDMTGLTVAAVDVHVRALHMLG